VALLAGYTGKHVDYTFFNLSVKLSYFVYLRV
jgi:hypothetical protein